MAVITPTGGGNLILGNASPVKQTLATNYIDFTSSSTAGWAQQYLPDLYESEVERYGDRTIGGFLTATGSEMPMSSDQIIWTEQGRLHISYTGGTSTAGLDNNVISGLTNHAIRTGQTVVVKDSAGDIVKAYVVSDTDTGGKTPDVNSIVVKPYSGTIADGSVDLFVFGSEFGKATTGMTGAVTPDHISLTNKANHP